MTSTCNDEAPTLLDVSETGRSVERDTNTDRRRGLASKFIAFLETGNAPQGLFAPDVFCDFTMPSWRLQAQGEADVITLRRNGHPAPGQVPRHRFDLTPTGFVMEVEEMWDERGEHWYCREMFRVDVTDQGITQISVYCTGDWDSAQVARHAAAVKLIRP